MNHRGFYLFKNDFAVSVKISLVDDNYISWKEVHSDSFTSSENVTMGKNSEKHINLNGSTEFVVTLVNKDGTECHEEKIRLPSSSSLASGEVISLQRFVSSEFHRKFKIDLLAQ